MPPRALQVMSAAGGGQPLVGSGRGEGKRCTDCLCCLLFLVVVLAAVALGALGAAHGNEDALVRFAYGRDSRGRLCGIDEEVKKFKLTYFTVPQGHLPVSKSGESGKKLVSELQPVCTSKCPQSSAPDAETQNATAREADLCPADDAALCAWYGGNTTQLGFYCVDLDVLTVDGQAHRWLQDIRAAWLPLLFAPVVAIVLGFFFLGFVHRCGAVCIWVALLLSAVVPAALGLLAFQEAQSKAAGASSSARVSSLDHLSPENLKDVAYGFWALSGVVVLLACCFASAVRGVISVLKVASDFLTDVPSQMVQPLAIGLLQLTVLSVWAVAFLLTASIGLKEGEQTECLQVGDIYCLEWDNTKQRYGLVFLVFVLYWCLNFLHALSHFGTSYAVGAWYFAEVDPISGRRKMPEGGHSVCDCRLSIRAFCHGLVAHPGSLAFGACVISIAQVAQLLLWWATKRDEVVNQNPVSKCIRRVANCLAECFKRFVEFVSEHAYAEVALRGLGFCDAARKSLALTATRPALFALVGRVAGVVRLMGVAVIVAGTIYIYSAGLVYFPPPGLTSLAAPLVAVGVSAFVVAEVMMHPFSAASRAALHCLCIDDDHARDMSLSEPSRAPNALMHLAEVHSGGEATEHRRCCCC